MATGTVACRDRGGVSPATDSRHEGDSPTITVDGSGLLCIRLLLLLRERITDACAGTLVHIIATDPAAPLDLPAWCHLTGHHYLGPIRDSPMPTFGMRLIAQPASTSADAPWRPTPKHPERL